jgi:hypothetical protein
MTPTLRTLITDAIAIIEAERESVYLSEVDGNGVVCDLDARAELLKFDCWLARARKALESRS